jgi:hypothetical protein
MVVRGGGSGDECRERDGPWSKEKMMGEREE